MEPSNPKQTNNQEHETHTTALVFLVIVAFVISYVALTWSGDLSNPFNTPGEGDQAPATTTEATSTSDESHGGIIPQKTIEPTPMQETTNLPDGIYLEAENVTDNNTYEGGQQIVEFTTNRPTDDLYSEYRSWMEESEFEIIQELEDEYGAKVVGMTDSQQLTVSISNGDSEEGQGIMIDYVAR